MINLNIQCFKVSEKGLPPLQRHEKYEEWDEMKRAKYKFIWEYELYVKGSKNVKLYNY